MSNNDNNIAESSIHPQDDEENENSNNSTMMILGLTRGHGRRNNSGRRRRLDRHEEVRNDDNDTSSNENGDECTRRRTRRKKPDETNPESSSSLLLLLSSWKRFQEYQTHSLRINVSDIAACSGFHPFKDLIKLFVMDHVYQGSDGYDLLQHDAHLLGISLQTEQDEWKSIAKLAGPDTVKALEAAIDPKKNVQTNEQAQTIRAKVAQTAIQSKKLNTDQIKALQEAARHSVNTHFGTTWETDALDLYEQQCGWEISHRNVQLQTWPFQRHGKDTVIPMQDSFGVDFMQPQPHANRPSKRTKTEATAPVVIDLVDEQCNGDTANEKVNNDQGSTPCETGEASGTHDMEAPTLANHKEENSRLPCCSTASADDDITKEASVDCSDKDDQQQELEKTESSIALNKSNQSTRTDSSPQDASQTDSSNTYRNNHASSVRMRRPFFMLRGCVDGIRDELVPRVADTTTTATNASSDANKTTLSDDMKDDDSWVLNRVIVECKHRMHRLQSSPPLYEMIQATAYCLMYQVQDADLVQVLRTKPKRKSATNGEKEQSNRSTTGVSTTSEPRGAQDDRNENTKYNHADNDDDKHKTKNTQDQVPPEKTRAVLTDFFTTQKQKGTTTMTLKRERAEEKENIENSALNSDRGREKKENLPIETSLRRQQTMLTTTTTTTTASKTGAVEMTCHDQVDMHREEVEKWKKSNGIKTAGDSSSFIQENNEAQGPRQTQSLQNDMAESKAAERFQEEASSPLLTTTCSTKNSEDSSTRVVDSSERNDAMKPTRHEETSLDTTTTKLAEDGSSDHHDEREKRTIEEADVDASNDGDDKEKPTRNPSTRDDTSTRGEMEKVENSSNKAVALEISVDRIQIDDPMFQHRHHWESVILPRLRSWVEAVYRIRKDDGARYELLVALASPPTNLTVPSKKKAWEILFKECPWLKYCDTAYNREQ